jgi:hypothetical protein
MPKKAAAKKAVHRPLHLTSPLAHGEDVETLQRQIRKGLRHHKADWIPVAVDGQLGRQTIHAATFLAWIYGMSEKHRRTMKGGTLTKAAQHLLRVPADRSRVDRLRAKRRQKRLRQIRRSQHEGPKAAVAYAKAFIGTTENPAGSNSGPTITRDGKKGGISFWEGYFGLGACFWCLCFASYCVKAIGRAKVSGVLVNAAEIERMARAHTNGLVAVPIDECRLGDYVLCCFDGTGVPDHGELAAGPIHDGLTDDVGGNTSSDNSGSQANGGGVFPKGRDLGVVTCIARPLY